MENINNLVMLIHNEANNNSAEIFLLIQLLDFFQKFIDIIQIRKSLVDFILR